MTNLPHSRSPTPAQDGTAADAGADAASEHFRQSLTLFSEPLLRLVAGKLLKPRNFWTPDELIERMVGTITNAPVIDRRLKELPAGCRRLLALIGLSGQLRWPVGNLIELLTALGEEDALSALVALLENGLLYPDLADGGPRLRCQTFEEWLSLGSGQALQVCSLASVTNRALQENLGLPDLSSPMVPGELPPGDGQAALQLLLTPASAVREADGVEWLLRLAILWQEASLSPLRRTQQGAFFKRDLDRLQNDPLLGSQAADSLVDLPDIGQFTAALALAAGILVEHDGEVSAGVFPEVWSVNLPAVLQTLWSALPRLQQWNGTRGGAVDNRVGNPYPAAYLLCALLLLPMREDHWCPVAAITRWVVEHHPYWQGGRRLDGPPLAGTIAGSTVLAHEEQGLERFLLGIAYHLRLVQAVRGGAGQWLVRLSALGRWLLGRSKAPTWPSFPQTLLVQPNLEILFYRQGATPELITNLSRFARWKNLGAACSLQLQPESVYAGLERGESFDSILQTLARHGMKPTPAPVIEALRTWAAKRERITIHPSATILEFLSAEDLAEALARGVPAMQISDRLAVIRKESDLDYQHFRLRGNRDYTLPPEPCITVADDGITLHVDLNRSDLLLESELRRFAEEVDFQPQAGRRSFRLTPASMSRGRDCGHTLESLENWFLYRCSQPLPNSARLLLAGHLFPSPRVRRLTVLQVAGEELALGLLQWPVTRGLIEEQIGPVSLVIAEENLPRLQERLAELGVEIEAPPAESEETAPHSTDTI
jgi:hypothetical protein